MTDTNKKHGPVFVVGVPRSGTTLLRLMLNAHSHISLGPETHFFREIWEKRNDYGDLRNKDNLLILWEKYSHTKYFRDFGYSDIDLVKRLIVESVENYADFLRILLEIYANNNDKNVWGEKTPDHLFNVPEIVEWYHDARIIHVIRDPRAVCASIAKVPWASDDVVSNSRVWNRYLAFANKLKNGKYGNSIIEIRYEDLIHTTEEVLNEICSFLEIEFESGMLEFYRDSSRFVEKDEPWKNNVMLPLNKQSIEKWKQELSTMQQNEIEAKAQHYMCEYGYLNSKNVSTSFNYKSHLMHVNLRWIIRRILSHIKFFFKDNSS